MKIKVGKRYKHGKTIIEITEIAGMRYYFKVVSGPDEGFHLFDKGSNYENYLVPVNECIVIYRKDNKVIALDKTNGKTGVARCNPIDEFDFNVGANIAFARLMKPEQQEEPKKVTANDEFAMTLKVLIESLEKQGFSRKESIMIAVGIATGVAKGGN